MSEIRTFAPARGFRRGYLILALLAIGMIALNGWLLIKIATRHFQQPIQAELQLLPAILVGVLDQRITSIEERILTYLEQPTLRTNVEKIVAGQVAASYQTGFWDAVDASCRSFVTGTAEIKNMALTDLQGNKIAGTGSGKIDIEYSHPMEPIHYSHTAAPDRKGYLETWIIPVRSVDARPIAYLVTEVRPFGSLQKLQRLITQDQVATIIITDAKGAILTLEGDARFSDQTLLLHDQVEIENDLFFIASQYSQVRDWKVYLAIPAASVMDPVRNMLNVYLITLLVSAILLGLLAVILAKKFAYLYR
ncbi:hypothetical protein KJ564_00645 [bacterium]|nr:hypothetical protein [bacterium]